MRFRSFKLRIALLSVLLSGLVLSVFGAWAWTFNYRMSLRRIDQEIRDLGHRHLAFHQNPEYWDYVGESLRFVFGNEDAVILLVKNRRGDVVHQSANWPSELSPEAFTPSQTFPHPADAVPGRENSGPAERREDLRPGKPHEDVRSGPRPEEVVPAPAPMNPGGDFIPMRPGERQPPGPENAMPPMPVPGQNQAPGDLSATQPLRGMPRDRRGPPRPPGFPKGPPPRPLPVSPTVLETAHADGQEWRIGILGNPEVTMVLGLNLDRFNSEMARARNAFLVAIPAALLLIAGGGWLLAQRALRPVRTLTRTAERITAKGLDQRIPAGGEDAEFMRLIAVFNEMMDRLERGFQQAVRFSADAAHELKTPLTILQGELEQALHTAEPGSPQQQVYSSLLEEVQRLKVIIRKLLLLSLADSGQLKLNLEPLDLTEMLESAYEDTQILGPTLRVQKDLAAGVWVLADRDLLRQVVQNLTSNAIKYNRPRGAITFQLQGDGKTARFTIRNTGLSIPPAERDKVFDRFYRADPSRNRKVDGTGLGLSLARELARAHHGDLALVDAPEGYVAFRLDLPQSPPPVVLEAMAVTVRLPSSDVAPGQC